MSVKYVTSQGNIHTGTGFLFLNILRPALLMRPIFDGTNPPAYSDPPAPGAWAATEAVTLGQLVLDTGNNVQICTTAGSTGATEPANWAPSTGGTTTDGTVTWTNAGPSWIWKISTSVIYSQQIRDSNGNIQFCLTPGVTAGSVPTWATIIGATTNDGTATWICLGPTLASGAIEGDITFEIGPKLLSVTADQYTAPIGRRLESEMAKITGTFEELSMAIVAGAVPGSIKSSGTDPNWPAGAQNFEQIDGGGLLQVLQPSVCLVSPRPDYSNPSRYVMAWLKMAVSAGAASFPFSLKKVSGYKVDWEGNAVTYLPAGHQIYGFNRAL